MKKRLAVKTTASKSMGMGHITRMLHLAEYLKKDFEILFFVKSDRDIKPLFDDSEFNYNIISENQEEITLINNFNPDLIIIDERDTFDDNLKELRKISRIITFDNTGESDYADRLINSLPLPKEIHINANFSGIEYLIFNESINKNKKLYASSRAKNILVTFGGSDPNNLTQYIYKIFREIKTDYNVKFILGPMFNENIDLEPFETIRTDNIFEEIAWADIVITGFGMTVFEALLIGAYPVLINPTAYHNSLAETVAVIKNLGVGGKVRDMDRIKAGILEAIEDNNERKRIFKKTNNYIDNKGKKRIKEIINELITRPLPECPICSNKILRVAYRNKFQNIYFCEECQTLCRDKDYKAKIPYESDYFLDSYKTQYGKTYLDDKENINKLNEKRIEVINSLIDSQREIKPLLELGCAMGFFLEIANNNGYKAQGIEISKYAVSYCKYTAELDVVHGDFLKLDYHNPIYEVIAGWYFIEHIKDFEDLIKKMKGVLRDSGIIAFATPNCFGVSGQKNIKEYASKIPDDHYIEFSPNSMIMLLEKIGFKIEEIVSTGIHYERWLGNKKKTILNNKFFEKIYKKLAKKKYLGDTFEIYARKV